MSSSSHSGRLQRERFLSASDAPAQTGFSEALLRLLLHQDGSTTRLLEAMGGGAITVHVVEQGFVQELPVALAGSLPGNRFLRRLTTLEEKGRVLLDSLSYIAPAALPDHMVHELVEGVRPIGQVFAQLWTQRAFRTGDTCMFDELWASVGLPDPKASRSTVIIVPAGPCVILAETFRAGALEVAMGV